MWIEESSHLKQVRLSSNCLIRCNDNNMIQQRQKARATGFSSLWVVNSIISLNTYYSSQTHTASQDGWKYLWCRAKKGHATFRPSGLWRGSFYLLALWALKCNIYIKMCNSGWKFHFFQLGIKNGLMPKDFWKIFHHRGRGLSTRWWNFFLTLPL